MEEQKKEQRKFGFDEQVKEARDIRCILHERELFAEECSTESALEFTKLEVQIAIVILGIIGVYLDNFKALLGASSFLKGVFFVTIFSLIGSLAIGLLHLKILEKFWEKMAARRELRFQEWYLFIINKTTFEEAMAYQEGTKMGAGQMVDVPKWTWILQSVFLGIGIVTISALSIYFIINI